MDNNNNRYICIYQLLVFPNYNIFFESVIHISYKLQITYYKDIFYYFNNIL